MVLVHMRVLDSAYDYLLSGGVCVLGNMSDGLGVPQGGLAWWLLFFSCLRYVDCGIRGVSHTARL